MKKESLFTGAAFLAAVFLSTYATAVTTEDETVGYSLARKAEVAQQIWDKHYKKSTQIADVWESSIKTAEAQ